MSRPDIPMRLLGCYVDDRGHIVSRIVTDAFADKAEFYERGTWTAMPKVKAWCEATPDLTVRQAWQRALQNGGDFNFTVVRTDGTRVEGSMPPGHFLGFTEDGLAASEMRISRN
ncbi:hypothetical protein [Tropicimonas sp. IMCC6043]|uniref:hypothetical protein n=1 Tax=Tropicimonas sp. IMCC6043 TaxID=2510645 RepID=UPI00101DE65A|nr:hypothetical protein [Tropicimonas sp. IMCC6043]RYH05688.1 hypothetical protein EU800_26020 [Tropicimonas sp. IMCC6043]